MATTEHDIIMQEVTTEGGTKNYKILYPLTKGENVLCEDGKTVEEKLAESGGGKKTWNIALDTTWTGAAAPYTKTVSVNGILATDIVNIYPIYSDVLETRLAEKDEYNKISMIHSANGSVTITCDEEAPEIALNVRLEVLY